MPSNERVQYVTETHSYYSDVVLKAILQLYRVQPVALLERCLAAAGRNSTSYMAGCVWRQGTSKKDEHQQNI